MSITDKLKSLLSAKAFAKYGAYCFSALRRLLVWPIHVIKNLVQRLITILRALKVVWLSLGPRWFRSLIVVVLVCSFAYHKLQQFLTPNLTKENIYQVRYLNEGWDEKIRQTFYYTPQGTELLGLDYEWLINLELPMSHELMATASNMRGWGFIVDPGQHASPLNQGNLPVGMSRHIDPVSGKERLDLGCAMCHTGELHYKGTALRIDGGQSVQSISTAKPGEFITTLGATTFETLLNPFKWDRFATRIAGKDKTKRKALRKELWAFAGNLKRFMGGAGNPKWYPVEEGRGRTDAVGRIANVVFGYDLDQPENYHKADAPASYPFIWDIWRFDWVQYTGFTNQAMARNVGESLGVLAPIKLVDKEGKLLPADQFGQTLIDIDGMHCVETLLRDLRPPKWPEDILGKINIDRAKRGKDLFAEQCVFCHGPHQSKPYNWPIASKAGQNPAKQIDVNVKWDMAGDVIEKGQQYYRPDWRETIWAMPWISIDTIGTDPKLANNYMDNKYDASVVLPGSEPVNAGDGLQVLLNRLVPTLYQRWDVKGKQIPDYDGLNVPFRIANQRAYKSRPLHGVWATPPFLHNGSVPSIYDLLSPLSVRPKTFYVGNREYDPVKLGYETGHASGSFLHDTSIPGNQNIGHLFTDEEVPGRIGEMLSEDERMDILEYIKVMGNPDFSERLGGDPLNWDNYAKAPLDESGYEACKAVHSRDELAIQMRMEGAVQ